MKLTKIERYNYPLESSFFLKKKNSWYVLYYPLLVNA